MITRLGSFAQIKGSSYSLPCIVATTASITLSGTQTIDGVTVAVGDRVLVKNQGVGADNGIYIVASGAWARSLDMSVSDDVFQGLQIFVISGIANGGKVFILSSSNPIVLNSTVLTFTVTTSGTSGTAGTSGSSGTSGYTPANQVTGTGTSGQVSYFNGTSSITGNNNFFWDATNNRLGIGLTNPQRSLEVYSATPDSHIRISGAAPSVSMGEAITGAVYQAKFGLATAANDYVTGTAAGDFVILSQTGNLILGTNTTSKMQVNYNGTVSIGNTNSTYNLDVTGTGRFTSQLSIGATLSSWGSSWRPLQMGSYGSFISGRTDDNSMFIGKNVYFDGTNWIGTTTGYAQQMFFDNTGATIFRNVSATAATATGFNETMRITSGGNVGIGTSSPLTKLVVATASNVNLEVRNGADFGLTGVAIDSRDDARSTRNALFLYGSPVVIGGGNVGIGTTSPSYLLQLGSDSAAKPTSALWTIASDARIKENINPYNKGLKELLKINPITYDYNGLGGYKKGKGGVGIIAQQIMDILPDSVNSVKAKLNETDEEETDILNFNGHELIYVLINAIKEQQAQIEELKTKIK